MSVYPWQRPLWQTTLARWHARKLPHALLLAGPKDLGKLAFATHLAERLLCQGTPTNDDTACHACVDCHLMLAGSHPDFFLLQPESDSKIIKIEAIRELLESLQQTAQGGQQVVLIEPVEAMNISAANALLKALEEPAGQVTFLLVSHQLGSVPATIRSRCQKTTFPIPPIAVSLAWLQQQLPERENLASLLTLCENIPLRAYKFDQEAGLTTFEKCLTDFIQLSDGQLTPVEMAKNYTELPEGYALNGLWLIVMDIIRLRQNISTSITYLHQLQALTAIAKRVTANKLFHFLDQLMVARRQGNAKINLNTTLLWEKLFIGWVK